MSIASSSSFLGKRKEPHTIIIARGDQLRHFTLRPWMLALGLSLGAVLTLAYLLATFYLVLRDDLVGASLARQARMQQAYEDRISSLRAQVDRITSRQLLDQQLMETKVAELMERQEQLNLRHGKLDPILDRVGANSSEQSSDKRALIERDETKKLSVASLWQTRTQSQSDETSADQADRMFLAINRSLRTIEQEQLRKIADLAEGASETADAISTALESAGLKLDIDYGKTDLGGPLIRLDKPIPFDTKVRELDDALRFLDDVKTKARKLPLANPAPGQSVSSNFGTRKDPLLGSPALHAGLDFRARTGTPALATAPGKVTRAGWSGGYGNMVEVAHSSGFATRYAHLSSIAVNEGDKVLNGAVIGYVGTTGRSTGPHLHYEVRRDGVPLNPVRFLRVGKEIAKYLALDKQAASSE